MPDLIMARAGEGAGDMVLALNNSFAWAELYKTTVELEYHWVSDKDFKYVDTDPETMGERVDLMHSKMLNPELVRVEHVWGSDVFEYHNAHNNLALRAKIQPRKFFYPKKEGGGHLHPHIHNVPFGGKQGQAEWEWAEKPTISKKIVMWDFDLNREGVKEYKVPNRGIDWIHIREKAYELFPDYEFVHLTYRDSFQKAHDEIRDCAFCLGYDGMWHMVLRNFGKLFVTFTDNISHAHKNTVPSCSAFRDEQIFEYLERLSDPEFLAKEQRFSQYMHNRRMKWYANPKG